MKMINYNRPFPASFRFFDDYRAQANVSHRPAVNIVETDDRYEIELLAPGRSKDLFEVDLHEGVLEISYTTEKTGDEAKPNFLRNEFTLRDFNRRFKLDAEVINDEDIAATYENGILRLTLPKREQVVKTARQIAVA